MLERTSWCKLVFISYHLLFSLLCSHTEFYEQYIITFQCNFCVPGFKIQCCGKVNLHFTVCKMTLLWLYCVCAQPVPLLISQASQDHDVLQHRILATGYLLSCKLGGNLFCS